MPRRGLFSVNGRHATPDHNRNGSRRRRALMQVGWIMKREEARDETLEGGIKQQAGEGLREGGRIIEIFTPSSSLPALPPLVVPPFRIGRFWQKL